MFFNENSSITKMYVERVNKLITEGKTVEEAMAVVPNLMNLRKVVENIVNPIEIEEGEEETPVE